VISNASKTTSIIILILLHLQIKVTAIGTFIKVCNFNFLTTVLFGCDWLDFEFETPSFPFKNIFRLSAYFFLTAYETKCKSFISCRFLIWFFLVRMLLFFRSQMVAKT